MKILAIEFSSEERSVALVQPDTGGTLRVVRLAERGGPGRPLELIDQVLRQAGVERAGIDAIVTGLGPGSYTGVRSAISLAQGWQLALGTPLLGISSADVLATQVVAQSTAPEFSVVIDAQRGEFYRQDHVRNGDVWTVTGPLRIVPAAEIRECLASDREVFGPALSRAFPGAVNLYPDASVLGLLARERRDFVPGEDLEPIYLRQTTFVKAPPPRFNL